MNSMSIATHCSMLMNGGKRIVEATNKATKSAQTTAQNNASCPGFDMRTPDVEATTIRKDTSAIYEIPFDTVFYVTHEGMAEIRSGMSLLSSQAQRALLMIDGFRNAADLSLRLRGGEAEKILHGLEGAKFIARIGNTGRDGGNGEIVDGANPAKRLSTERLNAIKQKITSDLSTRLGQSGDSVLGDVLANIYGCETALELRCALREAGDVLIVELGEEGVIDHLRAVGKNVMELIVQDVAYSD